MVLCGGHSVFRLQAKDLPACLSLLAKDVLWLILTDRRDERRVYFWPGANESLTPQGAMRHIALTDSRARRPHVRHADPVCAASLLGSHERRVSTERGSSRGRALGESAAGEEPSGSSKPQGLAGAGPGRSRWGLCCPGGAQPGGAFLLVGLV